MPVFISPSAYCMYGNFYFNSGIDFNMNKENNWDKKPGLKLFNVSVEFETAFKSEAIETIQYYLLRAKDEKEEEYLYNKIKNYRSWRSYWDGKIEANLDATRMGFHVKYGVLWQPKGNINIYAATAYKNASQTLAEHTQLKSNIGSLDLGIAYMFKTEKLRIVPKLNLSGGYYINNIENTDYLYKDVPYATKDYEMSYKNKPKYFAAQLGIEMNWQITPKVGLGSAINVYYNKVDHARAIPNGIEVKRNLDNISIEFDILKVDLAIIGDFLLL
ncbi:hypothetical protein ACFL5G_01155 [Candidatus Margulisiibacteriota bacterium]